MNFFQTKIPRRFSPGPKLPNRLEAHLPETSRPYPPLFPRGACSPPRDCWRRHPVLTSRSRESLPPPPSSPSTPPCAPPLHRAAPPTKRRRPSRAFPLSRPSRRPQPAAAASVSSARECQTVVHHRFLLIPRLERLAQVGIFPAAAAIVRSAVPESAPSRS
jgi:hypothetical protein